MKTKRQSRHRNWLRIGRIIRDLDDGYTPKAIVRTRGESLDFVQDVAAARRSAKGMLSQGAEPRVVYANFKDLLTRKACGL